MCTQRDSNHDFLSALCHDKGHTSVGTDDAANRCHQSECAGDVHRQFIWKEEQSDVALHGASVDKEARIDCGNRGTDNRGRYSCILCSSDEKNVSTNIALLGQWTVKNALNLF